MLRGNPPPSNILFFLFLSISFPSLFKKKSENFGGGGFEPPEPPLKYALDSNACQGRLRLARAPLEIC